MPVSLVAVLSLMSPSLLPERLDAGSHPTPGVQVALAGEPRSAQKPPDLQGIAYVQADALNVRRAPERNAPIVARLRIGTAVRRGREHGEWSAISFESPEGALKGYAVTALLGSTQPSLEVLEAEARLGDRDVALRAAQRWAAMAPHDPEARRRLLELTTAADDPRGETSPEAGAEPLRYIALCRDGRVIARYDGRSLQPLATDFAPDSDLGAFPPRLPARVREGLGLYLWHLESGPLDGTPFPRPVYRKSHVEEGANSDTTTAGGVFLGGSVCGERDVVLSDHPFARGSLVAHPDRSALERVTRALEISWPISGAVVTAPDPLLAVISGGTPKRRHRAVVQLGPSPRVVAHAEVHEDEMGTYGDFGDVEVFRWSDGTLFFTWRFSFEDAKSNYPGAYTTSSVWVGVVRPGADAVATAIALAVFRGG